MSAWGRLLRRALNIQGPSPRPVGSLQRIPNPHPALNLAIPWETPRISQPNREDPVMGETEQGVKTPGTYETEQGQVTVETIAMNHAKPAWISEPIREHVTRLETETPDGVRILVEITQPEATQPGAIVQARHAVTAAVGRIQASLRA